MLTLGNTEGTTNIQKKTRIQHRVCLNCHLYIGYFVEQLCNCKNYIVLCLHVRKLYTNIYRDLFLNVFFILT